MAAMLAIHVNHSWLDPTCNELCLEPSIGRVVAESNLYAHLRIDVGLDTDRDRIHRRDVPRLLVQVHSNGNIAVVALEGVALRMTRQRLGWLRI